MFLKVLAAVEHAHGHAVIHRDLKPANILFGADGNPKLLDFGIAKVLGETEAAASATRILTPEFAAPEQLRGQALTTATDTYLAGGVLYQIAHRRQPPQSGRRHRGRGPSRSSASTTSRRRAS